jgi:hypothetical protein
MTKTKVWTSLKLGHQGSGDSELYRLGLVAIGRKGSFLLIVGIAAAHFTHLQILRCAVSLY